MPHTLRRSALRLSFRWIGGDRPFLVIRSNSRTSPSRFFFPPFHFHYTPIFLLPTFIRIPLLLYFSLSAPRMLSYPPSLRGSRMFAQTSTIEALSLGTLTNRRELGLWTDTLALVFLRDRWIKALCACVLQGGLVSVNFILKFLCFSILLPFQRALKLTD